jgi:hypothetical protein
MSRAFLYACALLYLGFGLWVLLSPGSGLAHLRVDISHVNALSDLRGSHGGLNVAIGLFLLWAAGDPRWFRYGLWLVFLMNLGYLGGRAVSIMADGVPVGIVPLVMLLEAVLLVIALLLVRRAGAR